MPHGAVRDAVADLRSGETLLITADHGMVDVPRSAHVVLQDLDGLLGDVGHILRKSGTGARIQSDVAIKLIAACARPDWSAGHSCPENQGQCLPR